MTGRVAETTCHLQVPSALSPWQGRAKTCFLPVTWGALGLLMARGGGFRVGCLIWQVTALLGRQRSGPGDIGISGHFQAIAVLCKVLCHEVQASATSLVLSSSPMTLLPLERSPGHLMKGGGRCSSRPASVRVTLWSPASDTLLFSQVL